MEQRSGPGGHAAAGGAGGGEGVQPHYWAQRSSHGGRVPALSTKDAASVPPQQGVSTPAAAAAVLAGLHRQEYVVGDGLFLAAAPPADLVLTRESDAGRAASSSSSDADALAFSSAGLASYAPASLRRLPSRILATVPFRVQLPGTPRAAVERMRRLEREYLAQAVKASSSSSAAGSGVGSGAAAGARGSSVAGGPGGSGSASIFGDTSLEDVLCRIQCWATEDVASPAVDRARSAASGNFGGSLEVDATAAGAAAAAQPLQGALLSLMPGEEVDALARVSCDAAGAGAGEGASAGGSGEGEWKASSQSLASLTGAAQLYAALASSGPLIGTQHSQMQRYVLVRRARDGHVGFVPLQALSLGSAPVALSSALPGVASHGRA